MGAEVTPPCIPTQTSRTALTTRNHPLSLPPPCRLMTKGRVFGEANAHGVTTLWARTQLAICSLLLVLAASGQAVSFKSVGYPMRPYPYFILLSVSWSFVPILFGLVFYIHRYSGGFEQEQTTLRFKLKFVVIGIFNAFNGVLVIFSNPYVGGVLQTMLLQAAIPFTMAVSVLTLKARYNVVHYVGVGLIFGGIFIYIAPNLNNGDSITGDSKLKWVLVFLLSQVPQALQSVYQESAFRGCKCNVIYMMAWSSLAQAVCLVLLAPINLIPGIVDSSLPFLDVVADGAKCALNMIDGCEHAGYLLGSCVMTMLLTNIMQAYIVKIASASFSVVLITLVTPVSAIAFTIRFIMGSNTEKLTPITWLALVVLLIGVLVFRAALPIAEQISALLFSNALALPLTTSEAGLLETPREQPGPKFMSSRLGIISSEYTAAGGDSRGLLFECTHKPVGGSLDQALFSPTESKRTNFMIGHSV